MSINNGSINNVYERVSKILVDALGIDEEDITPNCQLQADLGAESIDYLDIVFRIEHEFSIKITKGELFPENTPIEELRKYTVKHLVDFVVKKVVNENVIQ